MAVTASTPQDLVDGLYASLPEKVAIARRRLGRPLTLTEKILFAHLTDPGRQTIKRGESYADLLPDRVAMQDATAQMALLQFMTAGLDDVAVPATVHCDHLIRARVDGKTDLAAAADENAEVYDFLRTVSARYGVGFWKPGSGIIHQVVLEQYAFPGGMMIGTDSHTPNAGGLGMIAIGVGGADAVDVMVGGPFNVAWPRIIGVRLVGRLSGWASPKDVILKVAQRLTVAGGTGAVIEYYGPGVESISATGRATICNMGAEIGATTSIFPYDQRSADYLRATGRADIAAAADRVADHLSPDPDVDIGFRVFDETFEINLDSLTPLINGPHTPDRAHQVAKIGAAAQRNGWPVQISAALIGSCTNSSYEDITRTASIARQAAKAGLRVKTQLLVTPGSERVRATIERDGLLADLEAIGATVLANACGPCIGQWKRDDMEPGQANTIVTSYNRNFPKRNDGSAATFAFVTSPETVMALALAGTLDFDPLTNTIDGVTLAEPVGQELPEAGFEPGDAGFEAPPDNRAEVQVVVRPDSRRLQLLDPFPAWDGADFENLSVLLKASGKCTTDHISAAGPWLAYRGHLENISGNLYLGATNAFTGAVGEGVDSVDGVVKPFPAVAKSLKTAGRRWIMVGDENYGEGSSREHAAMEPRFMGGAAILARSFARIAEANLKKQGLLPLWLADPSTYDEILADDTISILGLAALASGQPVACRLNHADGSTLAFSCTHTLSPEHIAWFRAGGALNLIRQRFSES